MSEQPDGNAVIEIAKLARAGSLLPVPKSFELDLSKSGRAPMAKEVTVAVRQTAQGEEFVDLSRLIEPWLQRPSARKGTATAQTLVSFIDLVNRHKGPTSVLFGDLDWKKPSLQAVIDYHDPAAVRPAEALETELDPFARHMRHRIHYAFPLDDAWKAWVAADGKAFGQVDFAEFLEDRIADLASPTEAEKIQFERLFSTTIATPAQVVEMSRGLQVLETASVKNQIRLSSGEVQIEFATEHRTADGNLLLVPGLFMICVPVFAFGERMSLPVRLRYRRREEKIIWSFHLWQPEIYVTGAVQGAFGRAGNETGLPVFEGTPEA
jgi:hypothetical protein